MTAKRNFETLIQNAFIAVLEGSTDITNIAIVREWMDGDNGKVYPIVLVNCDNVLDEFNSKILYKCSVDIACLTYNSEDRNKEAVYSLIAAVRDIVADGLLAALNEELTGIAIQGVIEQNMTSQFDENNTNIISIQFEVHFQYAGN